MSPRQTLKAALAGDPDTSGSLAGYTYRESGQFAVTVKEVECWMAPADAFTVMV